MSQTAERAPLNWPAVLILLTTSAALILIPWYAIHHDYSCRGMGQFCIVFGMEWPWYYRRLSPVVGAPHL